jgi:hypothetical protein
MTPSLREIRSKIAWENRLSVRWGAGEDAEKGGIWEKLVGSDCCWLRGGGR